ncbi:MAG TPA: response regulator [Pyrinomonadaceae bacterium]|jgi:PAS domain S-box-containing protein
MLLPETSQTILVVNDDPDHLDMMRLLLEKAGYRVVTAPDGREGVHLASTLNPDLVISDVNMPVLDGIELCRRLRAQPGTRLLPIMLVSAERMGSTNAVEGLRAGADDYLEAPYDPMRMVAKVTRLLERRRAEERLRHSERQLAEAQRLARIGNWEWDIRTNTVVWSDELYRVFGLEPQEFGATYEAFLERLHPDDRQEVMSITERALERPGPFTHYHRVILPGGSVRILHNRGEVIVGEDGRPVRMFGTEQDVTERRQAEEQLERSNEQLRSLSVRLQAVREEESIRIAREIHDELGGALTGLKMDLSWISKRLAGECPAAVRQKLQSALELIDETVVKVRNISTELRPSVLDDLGLAAAIEWQAREFEKRTEIRCEIVSLHEDITFSPEKSTAVFRIFQEILTNVSRHAQASRVEVRMTGQGGDLLLKVSDNGRGIEEGKVAEATSIGLLGMRERAMIFGGQVDVAGVEGRGTTVVARIPLG